MLVLVFSIFLLLLILYTPMLATKAAAQANNNNDANTNLVKAVQEASQNGTEYLKAKFQ